MWTEIKLIDLFVKIANGLPVPTQIKVWGMTWYYEEPFGQYKDKYGQELIKYLHDDLDYRHCGFIYKAMFNSVVEYYEEEINNEIN